jgi:hypothetical protein
VYIAGPLNGSGDRAQNVRNACWVGSLLRDAGHIPFVPHTSVVWHEHYPAEEENWLQWDFAWLDLCDVLIRLPGESPGSDREVERAGENGMAVFVLDNLGDDLQELVLGLGE